MAGWGWGAQSEVCGIKTVSLASSLCLSELCWERKKTIPPPPPPPNTHTHCITNKEKDLPWPTQCQIMHENRNYYIYIACKSHQSKERQVSVGFFLGGGRGGGPHIW